MKDNKKAILEEIEALSDDVELKSSRIEELTKQLESFDEKYKPIEYENTRAYFDIGQHNRGWRVVGRKQGGSHKHWRYFGDDKEAAKREAEKLDAFIAYMKG